VSGPELLFVGHGAERSGPPVFLANLEGWLRRNATVDGATLLARGGPLVDDYRPLGPVRVLDAPWAPARLTDRLGPVRTVRDRWGLRGWRSPRVAYINTMAPSTLRLLAALDPATTVIAHVHELEAALRYGLDDGDRRTLAERADRYVAASQAVADNLVGQHGVDPDRVVVHHEFVTPVEPLDGASRDEARRRRGLPEDAFVVIGSGMLEWRKAPELFVRLAADLRARTDRTLAFVWVGGADRGPLWAPLDHEAHHLGVADVVRFVGQQDDAGSWFRLGDAFALTSREDAFPLAALEAASAGLPIVTFATGGMVEFVGEDTHGAVVDYPDTEAFADRLAALAEDDDRRRSVGAGAAAAVRARHVTAVAAPRLWADVARWTGL
jgi:glycosyltransferase involved in cell wall biosynthesis